MLFLFLTSLPWLRLRHLPDSTWLSEDESVALSVLRCCLLFLLLFPSLELLVDVEELLLRRHGSLFRDGNDFFQRNLISNWKLRHKAPPFLIVPKIDGVKKLHFHHCPDPASPVTSIVVSQFTSSTTEYQLSFNSRCFLTLTFIRILLLLHCEVWLEMPQSALDTFFLSILFPSTCTFMLEQHQG